MDVNLPVRLRTSVSPAIASLAGVVAIEEKAESACVGLIVIGNTASAASAASVANRS